MKTLTFILKVLSVLILIDFICFTLWFLSGQHPADGFYFGALFTNLLKIILI